MYWAENEALHDAKVSPNVTVSSYFIDGRIKENLLDYQQIATLGP